MQASPFNLFFACFTLELHLGVHSNLLANLWSSISPIPFLCPPMSVRFSIPLKVPTSDVPEFIVHKLGVKAQGSLSLWRFASFHKCLTCVFNLFSEDWLYWISRCRIQYPCVLWLSCCHQSMNPDCLGRSKFGVPCIYLCFCYGFSQNLNSHFWCLMLSAIRLFHYWA